MLTSTFTLIHCVCLKATNHSRLEVPQRDNHAQFGAELQPLKTIRRVDHSSAYVESSGCIPTIYVMVVGAYYLHSYSFYA